MNSKILGFKRFEKNATTRRIFTSIIMSLYKRLAIHPVLTSLSNILPGISSRKFY